MKEGPQVSLRPFPCVPTQCDPRALPSWNSVGRSVPRCPVPVPSCLLGCEAKCRYRLVVVGISANCPVTVGHSEPRPNLSLHSRSWFTPVINTVSSGEAPRLIRPDLLSACHGAGGGGGGYCPRVLYIHQRAELRPWSLDAQGRAARQSVYAARACSAWPPHCSAMAAATPGKKRLRSWLRSADGGRRNTRSSGSASAGRPRPARASSRVR